MTTATLARKSAGAPTAPQATLRSGAGALRIGDPDDALEREADRVADAVMDGRSAAAEWSFSRMNVSAPLRRKCAECEEEDRKTVQRKAAGRGLASGEAPPIVQDALSSPGRPVDAATRVFMERRFGRDFGDVRLHTDAKAAESARAVDARAYTVGRDIVFASGQFTPETIAGKHLLAHELVHTIQHQSQPSRSCSPPAAGAKPKRANEADAAAARDAAFVDGAGGNATLRRQPYGGPNVGPPVSELPKPPIFSCGQDEKGNWVCKGQNIPGVGSTPDVPVDVRKIPDIIKEKLNPGGQGRKGLADCRGFPGFTPGGSSEHKGECCRGIENKQNCCPPQKIAVSPFDARCCKDGEKPTKEGACVKEPEKKPEIPLPEPTPAEPGDFPTNTLPEGVRYA